MAILIASGKIIADTELPTPAAPTSGESTPSAPAVHAYERIYGGNGWHPRAGNPPAATALALGTYSSTQETSNIDNAGHSGILVMFSDFEITTVSGTCRPQLRCGSQVIAFGPDLPDDAGASEHCWMLGPGLVEDDAFQATISTNKRLARGSVLLPRTFTIRLELNGTISVAGSISYYLIGR